MIPAILLFPMKFGIVFKNRGEFNKFFEERLLEVQEPF